MVALQRGERDKGEKEGQFFPGRTRSFASSLNHQVLNTSWATSAAEGESDWRKWRRCWSSAPVGDGASPWERRAWVRKKELAQREKGQRETQKWPRAFLAGWLIGTMCHAQSTPKGPRVENSLQREANFALRETGLLCVLCCRK